MLRDEMKKTMEVSLSPCFGTGILLKLPRFEFKNGDFIDDIATT